MAGVGRKAPGSFKWLAPPYVEPTAQDLEENPELLRLGPQASAAHPELFHQSGDGLARTSDSPPDPTFRVETAQRYRNRFTVETFSPRLKAFIAEVADHLYPETAPSLMNAEQRDAYLINHEDAVIARVRATTLDGMPGAMRPAFLEELTRFNELRVRLRLQTIQDGAPVHWDTLGKIARDTPDPGEGKLD